MNVDCTDGDISSASYFHFLFTKCFKFCFVLFCFVFFFIHVFENICTAQPAQTFSKFKLLGISYGGGELFVNHFICGGVQRPRKL